MDLGEVIAIAAILLIIGGAVAYIIKAKKSGKKCIGCPDSGSCHTAKSCGSSGTCSGCGGCSNSDSNSSGYGCDANGAHAKEQSNSVEK